MRTDGRSGRGATAKDLILHSIGVLGVGGATRRAIDYAGEAIIALDMPDAWPCATCRSKPVRAQP